MYRTDVITWFEDGRVAYQAYDTGVTMGVQSAFGPLRIWKDSRCRFQDKARFGRWQGVNYPSSSLEVDADGFVHGLVDRVRRVKPECKKERAALVERFKQHAVPRILLGEFGESFVERTSLGYQAQIPNVNREQVFNLFANNAGHEEIECCLTRMRSLCEKFGRIELFYRTPELAAFAAINALIRNRMQDRYGSEWHEWEEIKYPPVNVREL